MLSQWINYRKNLRPLPKEIMKESRLCTFGLGSQEEKLGILLPQMIMVQEVIPGKENQACCYHDYPCSV